MTISWKMWNGNGTGNIDKHTEKLFLPMWSLYCDPLLIIQWINIYISNRYQYWLKVETSNRYQYLYNLLITILIPIPFICIRISCIGIADYQSNTNTHTHMFAQIKTWTCVCHPLYLPNPLILYIWALRMENALELWIDATQLGGQGWMASCKN